MELNNEVLAEFVRLNQEVKEKTKRLDDIRQACKERGSFVTSEYTCLVDKSVRLGLPGLDEVTRCIQRSTLETLGLIRTIPTVTVRIIARRDYQVETIQDNS